MKTDKLLFKTREQVYHFFYGFILWFLAFSHALYLKDYFFHEILSFSQLIRTVGEVLSISFVISFANLTFRSSLKSILKDKITPTSLIVLLYILEVGLSVLLIMIVDLIQQNEVQPIPLFTYIIPLKIYELYLLEVDNMIGPFHLKKLFHDKYLKPKMEERVFLFADLVDSTKIAEQLGPEKYSQFLKESFEKFAVVYDYFGDIFQYVGDEVVITWKASPKHKNCYINGALACRNALEQSKNDFLNQYGISPQFRFSLHKGKVISTTIGKYKKEVSFHGEAINITSRIQEFNKALGIEMIFSETVLESIQNMEYKIEFLGTKKIRGIKEKLGLYTIN
ncbi:adenylate/guanylate cyclase domain-containing protein [Flammeovirga sp. EKP202]|uniref:adenylate/guanylate cyclase domain-containing protein n=1 Tax=Flammeovirga sp. EKP202 TaxID=2770592 RepID=UPI00165FEDA9|nr:adenylate/guanylate cyclase domain-containing protein [Flammeovirga sp. EKP202]MBD0403281.1 adenylate/guanylate cyclase domain-containing protein [Flammeovirga sp. EKP202]